MKDIRFTGAHGAVLFLSLVAFGFFVTNQALAFTGRRLELHSTQGAILLTVFLALGLVVQLAKIARGHQHWFEVTITLVLLATHIVAELAIWVQSQILGLAIPASLPQLIIGLYWVIGVIDILALYGARELALFKGESVAQQTARELAEAKDQAREARLQAALAEQARELQEHFAEQFVEQFAQRTGPPASGVAPANAGKKVYEDACPDCGKLFSSTTKRGLTNAINGHKGHCPGVVISTNGHRQVELQP